MNEILGKIVDKGESLTNNPHVVFNFLEIFYLLDIVSVIVFKKDICSFLEEDFSLIVRPEYFLFIAIFLMAFFSLYFISNMVRYFLSSILFNSKKVIKKFLCKTNSNNHSIYLLEKYAIEYDKSILYGKVQEQKQVLRKLSKQLDFNFLLGVVFFIHLAVCRNPISEYISSFASNIETDNPFCYLIFKFFMDFIVIIILLRFFHSFLSLSEYYVEYIESSEYDYFLREKSKKNTIQKWNIR